MSIPCQDTFENDLIGSLEIVGYIHSWASASRKLTPASAFRHAEF
jgi:hypothetical protein